MIRTLSTYSQLLFQGRPALEVPIGTSRRLSDLYLEGQLDLFCEYSILIIRLLERPFLSPEWESGARVFPLLHVLYRRPLYRQ